ncbi:hypothetical protein TcG_09963 [Trypanosoma cruzi]|nr:hypothetical protein TcG_09963 [Trypanosoma cruzi]
MLSAWHGEGQTQKRDTAWDVNLHCSDRHRIRICSHLLRSLFLPHFRAEDCAARSSSAMFGRRNMSRTNDLWEGMCTATRRKKMLRDDHHDKTGVRLCFIRLREGGLPPGRLGGLFLLRRCALFLFRCVFLRTCEGILARNYCEASVPSSERRIPLEKRHFLNLFWAWSSCRFNANLFCGFDACVSERFGLCSRPTRMWCARRREGACQPFYCLSAVAAAAAFFPS